MCLNYCLSYLWSLWLYLISPHYLINDTIFGKVIEHKMCVLTFFTNYLIQRDIISNMYRSLFKVAVIFVAY
jgi:hypothetical protein